MKSRGLVGTLRVPSAGRAPRCLMCFSYGTRSVPTTLISLVGYALAYRIGRHATIGGRGNAQRVQRIDITRDLTLWLNSAAGLMQNEATCLRRSIQTV